MHGYIATGVGAFGTAAVGMLVTVDTSWPSPQVMGVAITVVTLIWGAIIKYLFSEFDKRMMMAKVELAKELKGITDEMRKEFVSKELFNNAIRALPKRRADY